MLLHLGLPRLFYQALFLLGKGNGGNEGLWRPLSQGYHPCPICPTMLNSVRPPAVSWCGPQRRPRRGGQLSTDMTGQQLKLSTTTHTVLSTWKQVPGSCQHWGEPKEGSDKGQRNQYAVGFKKILEETIPFYSCSGRFPDTAFL